MAEPIAIVGMACRFGGAPNLAAYWDLLVSGRDGIGRYPGGYSAAMDRFYAAAGTELGPPTANAGFLNDVDRFDADFFGISPREAELMDPQQRILLELTWDAVQDAGQSLEDLAGPRTGVFVGVWTSSYERILAVRVPFAHLFATSGNALFATSARLSNAFDLRGPELSINAACSSSLTAIHVARGSLLSGECDIAVVAGVNVLLRTDTTQGMARAGILSADGKCRFGSSDADGFARSEGAAVVLLKRLSRAQADGDRIYALVRGSAINNSGATSKSFTRPSEIAQRAVIERAIADAGVSPGEIDYVEAHGTATYAGDRIELNVLSDVLGRHPDRTVPLRVGSVKSNIGHTESAAGLASTIKVALALHHGYLPPSLNIAQPNPDIDWAGGGLALHDRGATWEKPTPRRAGISAFGVTGSNAHAIFEEAPPHTPAAVARDAQILALSARSELALRELASRFAERLDGATDALDVCFTASRRSPQSHRLAFVGANAAELAASLRGFAGGAGSRPPIADDPPRKAVMVFPGQGSQWPGMGRRLYDAEPAFRDALDTTSAAIEAETGWSARELLLRGDDLGQFGIERIQPVLFAVEVALAKLWISLGQAPAVCLGHSMGEVAAAHIAGALTLEDAVAVICRRSALMTRFNGQGAMALVELSLDQARQAIAGHEGRLSIAVSNAPHSTVLSGDPAALNAVLAALEAADVFCRTIAVDVAAHSPQMDAIASDLRDQLRDLAPRPVHTPMYSTAFGRFVEGIELDGEYWVANLRQPVLFHPALDALFDGGFDAFIEVSPHPILLPAIEDTARAKGVEAATVASLRRDEPEQLAMLTGLGTLFERGFGVAWRGVYPDGAIVGLPGYPWQRSRFWVDASDEAGAVIPGGHPLLGAAFASAGRERIWSVIPAPDAVPWLKDHVVHGSNELAPSAYIELADAVARELHPDRSCAVHDLCFRAAIELSARPSLQIVVTPGLPGRDSIEFFARTAGTQTWTLAASGEIVHSDVAPALGGIDVAAVQAASREQTCGGAEHATRLAAVGCEFGPAFRALEWYAIDGNELIGAARLPEGASAAGYGVHPALLDAAVQGLAALFGARAATARLAPLRVDAARITRSAEAASSVLFVARIVDEHALRGDVHLYAPEGEALARIEGLTFFEVANDAVDATNALLYLPQWEIQPPERSSGATPRRWFAIADAGDTAAAFTAALEGAGFAAQTIAGSAPAAQAVELIASLASAEGRESFAHPLGIVDFRALDLPEGDDVTDVAVYGASVASLASALDDEAPDSRLWLVTRGACAVDEGSDVCVAQASAWGLGAVVANERPSIRCSLVDLDPESGATAIAALVTELTADGAELRVALRRDRRFVARLAQASAELIGDSARRRLRDDERFDIRVPARGSLERIAVGAERRRAVSADEVEIEVAAAGLSFLDVLHATKPFDPDATSSPAIGMECAGRIVRAGSDVTGFGVGDEVIAVSPAFGRIGAVTSHIVVPQELVARSPQGRALAEAASIPIGFLTSYYALVELARMRRGETLLVHSATGGVGLAAIQIARWLGVTAFATAGTQEKRAFLRGLGVEHVMDFRLPGFADAVASATGGRGVDAILSASSASSVAENLSALAPYGRYLELGKRERWDDAGLRLSAFSENRSFTAVDLASLVESRPAFVGEMLRAIVSLVDDGTLSPLPVTTYAAQNVGDALRQMAQSTHIGKIVIDTRTSQLSVRDEDPPVRSDATYLITGGVGALGLVSAQALVAAGARTLVLCARRGANAVALETIEALRRDGADVVVRPIDLSCEADVCALLADVRSTLPPLRGVVHCAGVLADALLEGLTEQHFEEVMSGKVGGALLLDRLTRDDELDFFVVFSSVAALLGTPGQANYAAANAMLDALAQRRVAQGLPGQSIAWGPWADVGLAAAEHNRGARISANGLVSIAPNEGRAVFERCLGSRIAPRVAAMRFDVARWCDTVAGGDRARLFETLSRETVDDAGATSSVHPLRAGSPQEAERELRRLVVEHVAAVLRLQTAQVAGSKAFRALGLDSLMGLEVRNRLERSLELKLSVSMIWNYPTVDQLCVYLANRLGIASGETLKDAQPGSFATNVATADLESELGEAEALLASL